MSYYDLNVLAERYGVSPATLGRLAKLGQYVKPIRLGRAIRFAAEDVAAWERLQRQPAVVPTLVADVPREVV